MTWDATGKGGLLLIVSSVAFLASGCMFYGPVVVPSSHARAIPGTAIYAGALKSTHAKHYVSMGWQPEPVAGFQQAGIGGDMFESVALSLERSFAKSNLFQRFVAVPRGGAVRAASQQGSPLATPGAEPIPAPVYIVAVYFGLAQTNCHATCMARYAGEVLVFHAQAAPAGTAGTHCLGGGRCFRPSRLAHRQAFSIERRSGVSAPLAYKAAMRALVPHVLEVLSRWGSTGRPPPP